MKNTVMFKTTNRNGIAFIPACVGTEDQFRSLIEECVKNCAGEASYKEFPANKMPLEELPEDIQNQVRNTLRAYHSVTVTFENGKFSASACIGIKNSYNWDHFVAGTYKDDEVYTLEERRQNYKEEFGYAPCF